MAMTLENYNRTLNGKIKVYFGDGVPDDNAIFNKGDLYFRTDVASGAPWLYVATAASGTWKSVGNLA